MPRYGGRKLQPKQSCAFNNNILFRDIRIPTIGFLEYAIHAKCIRVGRSVAECIDASLVLYLFCYDFLLLLFLRYFDHGDDHLSYQIDGHKNKS